MFRKICKPHHFFILFILFILFIPLFVLTGCSKSTQSNTDSDANTNYESTSSISGNNVAKSESTDYYFRNEKLLNQHYEKHGYDMGFDSPKSYEKAASDVINNPSALSKTEAEDGDWVFYIEETNEFVVLSTDGFIRTYFLPDAGKRYYDKQ